jgi:acyl dehydratase
MCTYSWAAEACAAYLDDPARLRRLKVRFSRPVQPGDTVTLEGRCVAVDGATLRLELTARNQAGEDVLKNVEAEAVVAEP